MHQAQQGHYILEELERHFSTTCSLRNMAEILFSGSKIQTRPVMWKVQNNISSILLTGVTFLLMKAPERKKTPDLTARANVNICTGNMPKCLSLQEMLTTLLILPKNWMHTGRITNHKGKLLSTTGITAKN